MTLLEAIRDRLAWHNLGQQAIEPVLDWCAQRSLEPCVTGNPNYVAGTRYASCNHCMATSLLQQIGQALEVYP